MPYPGETYSTTLTFRDPAGAPVAVTSPVFTILAPDGSLLATGTVTVTAVVGLYAATWAIPSGTTPGVYRSVGTGTYGGLPIQTDAEQFEVQAVPVPSATVQTQTVLIPLTSDALTTLARAKLAFGITNTRSDSRMTMMINQVSDAISAYCNRSFRYVGAKVEQRTAQQRQQMVLGLRPLCSVNSVRVGTASDGTGGTLLATPLDYQIQDAEAGIVFRQAGWPDSRMANGEAVFYSPRVSAYAGITSGDSIQAYDPSPHAVIRNIVVTYSGGYVLPQYQQVGTINAASAAVVGLDTTNLTVGMCAYGSGIPAEATVASVDSTSQVSLSVSATGTGSITLLFGDQGIDGAQLMPSRLEGAVLYELDRLMCMTGAHALKSQTTGIGIASTFVPDDLSAHVKGILSTLRNHLTG